MDALQQAIGWLDDWLRKVGTEPTLRSVLICYARGCSSESMEDITRSKGSGFQEMGHSQDKIGWRRFMENTILT